MMHIKEVVEYLKLAEKTAYHTTYRKQVARLQSWEKFYTSNS